MMEDKNDTQSGIIGFLNSKFGLFIFSSILLTLLPFLYTNYQDTKTNNKERNRETNMLTAEINNRLLTIKTITSEKLSAWKVQDIKLATYGIQADLKPEYFNFRPIFKEYRDVTLMSLIIQLNHLTEEETQLSASKNLKKALLPIKKTLDTLVMSNRAKTGDTWICSLNDEKRTVVENTLIAPIDTWIKAWNMN